jgi:indoleacetamide hydrolase
MNRRLVLKMLAAASLSDFVPAAATTEDLILELDSADLLEQIRYGTLLAEQACEIFLQQYGRQRLLNAVTWIHPSDVLSRAREIDRVRYKGMQLPALAGLPILVKDNIDTAGFPTSAGTASLEQHFPSRNAPVVERLSSQGAIVMGKANMHELAFGVTSSNPTFGFVHNPYDPELIPGGSSGGSAAAVAARIVPAALGTDTVGSVRVPAAFCGIVGFRPSVFPRKQYSQEGVAPNMLDFDTVGPMGRCVADVAMLHTRIVGQRPVSPRSLEKVRIGVPRLPCWGGLDPEVGRVAEAALERLGNRGAVLVDIDLREIRDAATHLTATLASVGVTDLHNFLRTQVPTVSLREVTEQIASRDVRAAVEARIGLPPYPHLMDARREGRDAICTTYCTAFRHHGIQTVVFPTTVLLPPPIRAEGDDPYEMMQFDGRTVSKLDTILRNTLQAAALGAPALSLPAGLTRSGVPVALEFDGLPGNDRALLALGMAAETALGRLPAPPRFKQPAAAS